MRRGRYLARLVRAETLDELTSAARDAQRDMEDTMIETVRYMFRFSALQTRRSYELSTFSANGRPLPLTSRIANDHILESVSVEEHTLMDGLVSLMAETESLFAQWPTRPEPTDLATSFRSDEIVECSICLDTNPNVDLPCRHTFCLSCIWTWLGQNRIILGRPTCPVCRRYFVGGAIRRIERSARLDPVVLDSAPVDETTLLEADQQHEDLLSRDVFDPPSLTPPSTPRDNASTDDEVTVDEVIDFVERDARRFFCCFVSGNHVQEWIDRQADHHMLLNGFVDYVPFEELELDWIEFPDFYSNVESLFITRWENLRASQTLAVKSGDSLVKPDLDEDTLWQCEYVCPLTVAPANVCKCGSISWRRLFIRSPQRDGNCYVFRLKDRFMRVVADSYVIKLHTNLSGMTIR